MFENFKSKKTSVMTVLSNLYCAIVMERETRALLRRLFPQCSASRKYQAGSEMWHHSSQRHKQSSYFNTAVQFQCPLFKGNVKNPGQIYRNYEIWEASFIVRD